MDNLKGKIVEILEKHLTEGATEEDVRFFQEHLADQILALIQEEIKSCLPEESQFTGEDPDDYWETYDSGFNTCRNQILKSISDLK